MRFTIPLLSAVLVLPSALLLGGCPDTGGSLESFEERDNEINPDGQSSSSTGPLDCVPMMPGEADGDYLFTLSARLNPERAFTLRATVTTVENPEGGLSLTLSLQPLSAMDQMTPVCMSLDFADLPVGADGTFTWALAPEGQTITLCGEANPISGGDVVTSLTIDGALCGGDKAGFLCGNVTGKVVTPLPDYDLAGSTWTMQKIDGTPPAPVINCNRDPAVYD
jgi:hypothetical protein